MKLYLAGSLFSEADMTQRQLEGRILRENFPEIEIFNPIDQPFNENKASLPTPIDIFDGDTKAVEECDIFICDLSNEDAGVMVELGVALYTNTKLIIGINSDMRLATANKYDVPTYGMNHYVLGAILKHGKFLRNFTEAVNEIKAFLEEENK